MMCGYNKKTRKYDDCHAVNNRVMFKTSTKRQN